MNDNNRLTLDDSQELVGHIRAAPGTASINKRRLERGLLTFENHQYIGKTCTNHSPAKA